MPVFFHGGVYLGLVAIIYPQEDRVWVELTWSPDTVTWHRICPNTPLIANSENELAYDWGCVYAGAIRSSSRTRSVSTTVAVTGITVTGAMPFSAWRPCGQTDSLATNRLEATNQHESLPPQSFAPVTPSRFQRMSLRMDPSRSRHSTDNRRY